MTNEERANHGPKETHQDRRIDHQRRQVDRREVLNLAKESGVKSLSELRQRQIDDLYRRVWRERSEKVRSL